MLLEKYEKELSIVVRPLPTRMEIISVRLYPVGLMKELGDKIISLDVGFCIQVPFESLTSSNVSTLHSYCKCKGWKLHCLRDGNTRILYCDKR